MDSIINSDNTAYFSKLDAFEQAFLFVDESYQAVFLSAKASKLLEIRRGESLRDHAARLEPLERFAKKSATRKERRGSGTFTPGEISEEFTLDTSSGRSFQAVVFARPFETPDYPSGSIVVFHDVSVLEPFLKAIEQSRKNRALLLLASSHIGRNLLFDFQGKDLSRHYDSIERDFFKSVNSKTEDWMKADLLSSLSTAVDIIDPLVVSSAKIISEARTSALLEISQPNCLRILGHLLLEASDFVGPFGMITLKAELTKEKTAEVSLFAVRQTILPVDASPLDLYVYRRYMPVQYKVTTVEDEKSDKAFKGVQFGNASEVPDELRSENISIAAKIVGNCGCKMMIKHPKSELLVLSVSFALAQERL